MQQTFRRLLQLSVVTFGFFCVWLAPVQASTIFFDDMENGAGNWTATGLWHLQTNPQNLAIADTINPADVSLPDSGRLPHPYSGSTVWWYGSAADGTFLGQWDPADQVAKNGGTSTEANTGDLTSTTINLTNVQSATLSFRSWWEIEAVDVDRYDLITVAVTADNGDTWNEVAKLNPLNDVDGESWRPYSSGGLGQVGQWITSQVDLSQYVGKSIQLRFTFDTVDERYNGFRGWLVDDVIVTNEATATASFNSQSTQAREYCDSANGNAVTESAQFYVQNSQTVQISSTGDWSVTPFGSNNYVATGAASSSSKVSLNAGYYLLWSKFSSGQTCPNAAAVTATVGLTGGASQALAEAKDIVSFYGDHFVTGSTADFVGTSATQVASLKSTTPVDTITVVSSTEVQVTVPDVLAGTYSLQLTSPSGAITTLANALTVTTVAKPDIASVTPDTVNDAVDTALTINGSGFVSGALVTVGGVPLTNLTVTDFTITGTLLAGAPAGFQNVVVINPDGQLAKLVGGVLVEDNSATAYTPSGKKITKPKPVTGIIVTNIHLASAKVHWAKVKKAARYLVLVKQGKNILQTLTVTGTSTKLTNLTANTKYKVQVQALTQVNLSSKLSKAKQFKTKSY